ncbi:MAG: type IV pilus modification PilV family protein [Thermoguttaceae bacterium]
MNDEYVEEIHQIREGIYRETKDMSSEELIAYYHKASGEVRQRITMMQKSKPLAHAATRRGLSLLEILLSVFVLSVGLLGMLAVLPYAILQLSTVNRLDFAGNCGRAALNEIKTRKLAVDASTSFYGPYEGNPPTGFSLLIGPTSSSGPFHRCDVPVFVDPQIVEKYGYVGTGNSSVASPSGFDANSRFLPYSSTLSSSACYFPRLSAEMFQPPIPPDPSSGVFHNPDVITAQSIFYWDEDLNFVAPAEPLNNNPRPVLMHNAAGAPQSLNNYSWFYMVTPRVGTAKRYKLTALANPNTLVVIDASNPLPAPTPPSYSDWQRYVYADKEDVLGYDVDVIVCYNRRLTTPLEEVQITVPAVDMRIGMGGGSMTISSADATKLDMTETRWVLLSCQPNIGSGDPTVFAKWYEVVGLGEIKNGARELILAGPSIPEDVANLFPYYVTIVKGVCGVFSEYIAK